MMSIERPSPFCQTMICQGKIPYLLPNIRMETEEGREISYQTKGKRMLSEMMERGLEDDIFRIARRIVYCYYDLESEYFVPGRCLMLGADQIYVDSDKELYFQVDDAGHNQLYPIIRALLSDRWQDQLLIPESREEWLFLIEECEERDKLSRRIIRAQEEPEKQDGPVQTSQAGRLGRLAKLQDELVQDDKKIYCIWAVCFLLGVILSVFS